MLDGNHAYKLIQNQLSPVQQGGRGGGGGGTYNNLFDAHPPFQIDGNFGCTSGITEMLMQSANGEIHLIPALPDVWLNAGTVTGLRAIGGFDIVSIQWKDGKVVKAVIKSKLGGNLRLRVPGKMKLSTGAALKSANGKNTNAFFEVEETATPIISDKAVITKPELKETVVYDIPTKAGMTYTFIAQ